MTFAGQHIRNMAHKTTVAALALALATVPLAACGGQQATSDADSPAATSQPAAVDVTSWKTLGDAFTMDTGSDTAGWDDNHYVCVFQAGESYYRVVAKMTPDVKEKLDAVDYSQGDGDEQAHKVLSDLAIQSAEDITSEIVSQDELDKFKGKTGKDLVDAGFTFQDYVMYGGDQTGAVFAKGSFAYMFTFDVSIAEEDSEDEGKSVMDAKVSEVELSGASDSATDPTAIS